MKDSLNRLIRQLYSAVTKWWQEGARQEVDNYVALIGGTLGVAVVTLCVVLEFCLEVPATQAEARTQPGFGNGKPDVISVIFFLWPAVKLAITWITLMGFLGGSLWLVHRAYTKVEWHRNEELKERIAGQNEKPIK